MAKRAKPSKAAELAFLVVAGVVVYGICRPVLPTVSWVLIGIGVLMGWLSLVMPTYCDYRTVQGRGCTRRVRGKLRGCRTHARLKRDALWAALRLVNPGRLIRTTWAAPEPPVAAPAEWRRPAPGPSPQGKRDAVIFGCTVLSGVTGLVSAVAGVLAVA